MATIADILRLLDEDPDRALVLARLAEAEEVEIAKQRARPRAVEGQERQPDEVEKWERFTADGLPTGFGLEPHEIGKPARWLDVLVFERVLELAYITRSHNPYRLVDRELTQRALKAWVPAGTPIEEGDGEIPADLFEIISGHGHAKRILALALQAPRPVHVALEGDPATAKTLFLEELRRLPAHIYADGGMATKAGLVEALLARRPRYLLIDQVDHLPPDDQQALLGVMSSGRVARLRYREHQDELLYVWVFATANDVGRLSEPLRDRFQVVRMHPYSDEEYAQVCRHFLERREGVDPEIAAYIAGRLAPLTHSIRDAQRVARLAASVSDVDELLKILTFRKDARWPSPARQSARRR